MALISDYYREQNRLLHKHNDKYGSKGNRNAGIVKDIMKNYGAQDVLDYGCGKGSLRSTLGKFVSNYDPAIPKWSTPPSSAHLVVCADVLEHIEPECLHDVMSHIASLSKKAAFFTIACRKANQKLPDGTNTHKIIESPEWWLEKVSEYMDPVRINISTDRQLIGILAEPKSEERKEVAGFDDKWRVR